MMVPGSRNQQRPHPLLAEVRSLVHESRLHEVELGLTPAAESKSKAGVPPVRPTGGALDEMANRRAGRASADADDDDHDDQDDEDDQDVELAKRQLVNFYEIRKRGASTTPTPS